MIETIKLGDNKEYMVSTLDMGDLIKVDKRFGTTELNSANMEQISYWVYLALKKEHKDLTEEGLYKLIDMPFIAKGGLTSIFEALTKVNEWDKVDTKNVPSPQAGSPQNSVK